MKAIINAELVLHDHFMPEAVLFIEDGKIAGFGEMRNTPIPEGCEIIDAEGKYLAPGFIDIHSHCGNKVRFEEDPAFVAHAHLMHGVTTILATYAYEMSQKQYIDSFKQVREIMKTPAGENIGGVYMEGPYLNPKYGANRDKLVNWKGACNKEEYQPVIDEGKDLVKVWSVAPERENVLQFVQDAKKAIPDLKFTVAHSEATPQQIEKLMPYGLCIGTHHTNATGTIVDYSECRGVCVDECVNYNREIYAELICDSRGIHVNPYMLRLIRRIKGDDRIILISDQSRNNGPTPPGFEGVTDLWFDNLGEISGSKLYLDIASRNMMKHTGSSLVDVFNFASYNPAKAVGFTDRGEIAVGKKADLIICDEKINLSAVFLNGKMQDITEYLENRG